jgi:hypothetical protein
MQTIHGMCVTGSGTRPWPQRDLHDAEGLQRPPRGGGAHTQPTLPSAALAGHPLGVRALPSTGGRGVNRTVQVRNEE